MPTKKNEYFGKDVPEAIASACAALNVSREQLAIEVLETGSAGIFGLCRKRAHIRIERKKDVKEASAEIEKIAAPTRESVAPFPNTAQESPIAAKEERGKAPRKPRPERPTASTPEPPPAVPEPPAPKAPPLRAEATEPLPAASPGESKNAETLKPESTPSPTPSQGQGENGTDLPPAVILQEHLDLVREELSQLLALMDAPSTVTTSPEKGMIFCQIDGGHMDRVIGEEGRVLDSIQYLLRKMLGRRLPDRVSLAIDAGNYRETRLQELRTRAVELAVLVKEDGHTQSIPALNPSERRAVHMVLQDDEAIRSRSVGDGLFKKVLIYKPGKGRSPKPKKKCGNRPQENDQTQE